MSAGQTDAHYASVAVPIPVRQLFTYLVNDSLRDVLVRGSRVRVPFGRRKLVGTVVEWPAKAPDAEVTTKSIESLLPDEAVPATILELTRFVSDYYLCAWGEAIETALPPRTGPTPLRKVVRRTAAADPTSLPERSVLQRRLLEALPVDGTPLPLAPLGGGARRAAVALQKKGWVEILDTPARAERATLDDEPRAPEKGPTPTPGQAAVLKLLQPSLEAGQFAPHLLYGATGSGKTEVYFRAAEAIRRQGRSVLYLVPEIGLTPLLLSKVSRRFPGSVAVLHSAMPRRQRAEAWERARDGRATLVVGTRSAIFAPLPRLGLIVVDEEQDGSYKQDETPRYNARDLAVVRAREAGAGLLLGSATPSMETFQHARSGRYGLLRLGGRVEDRPLPTVTLIDMREEYRQHGVIAPLSSRLAEELRACVDRGEQALVLRNRRGWAAAVLCPRCGERLTCRRCSVAMTWHRSQRRLRCHYCGAESGFPPACPACGADDLKLLGEGTEKIEELIRVAVPQARVERMDRDTVRRKGAHEDLLRRFDRGEIDILAGTQMIAKGHDFPRVTVVGVLGADQPLGLPEFRAAEGVFQLLTQVAGRAGRGERPGTVLVQAFHPDHPVLRQAVDQDFEAFFDREIRYRRALRYPPLVGLVQVLIHDRDALQAEGWARKMGDALRTAGAGRLFIAGPGPAPVERLRGSYRQQILVRSAGRRRLIAAVEQALVAVEGAIPRRAIVIDVDPYSLL